MLLSSLTKLGVLLYGSKQMANDWRVAFRSHKGSELVVNTFCVHTAVVGIDTENASAGDVATAINTWLSAKYLDVLVADYTFDDITVTNLPPPTTVEAVHTVNSTGTLASGSGDLPQEVAMVVSLRSALANRRGRGRLFIPSPLHSSHLDAPDEWQAGDAYWANVGTLMDAMLAGHDFTAGLGGLVNFHASLRVWSRAGSASHDVTSYVRRKQPHWLRSRAS